MKRPVHLAVVTGLVVLLSHSLIAQTAPTKAPAGQRDIRHYIIVNGDNMSGSWNSDESPNIRTLRSRYGYSFAWFRDGSHEYVITDSDVLADLDKAMEPQKKVNALQADVNEDQSHVNALQAKVNAHQHDINAVQNEVNHRQSIVNQMQSAVSHGASAAEIDRLQAELSAMRAKPDVSQSNVNEMQSKVNAEQQDVNAEQAKVNEKQHGVNGEQHRASEEIAVRVRKVFNDALEHGAAQPVK